MFFTILLSQGKGKYDTLSNKATIVTPKGTSRCGPVVFNVGSRYILSGKCYVDVEALCRIRNFCRLVNIFIKVHTKTIFFVNKILNIEGSRN